MLKMKRKNKKKIAVVIQLNYDEAVDLLARLQYKIGLANNHDFQEEISEFEKWKRKQQ